ncbi:hemoglobin subunit beta-2-like isoform X1 [Dendropsophus ebraccatus]|uniref:hemoglobin subunit beta-2-like isoform X1 n=2 Tax=Dendropsophus ebraccatus TaxID=150705 RepID=UPI0038315BB4
MAFSLLVPKADQALPWSSEAPTRRWNGLDSSKTTQRLEGERMAATMVQWTAEERAAITSTWAQVNVKEDGHDALARLLIVYPWTQRYFSSFGNLSNVTAISGNAKVHAHGTKVFTAIGGAIEHLDDVKRHLADLSKSHAQELNVDPENFKRLGEVLVIVLASKLGSAFTPQVQAAWEKFINVLVAALSHGYF